MSNGLTREIMRCPPKPLSAAAITHTGGLRRRAHRPSLFVFDCWEGAALRSRLRASAEPLSAMLDVSFLPPLYTSWPDGRN
jgi:Tetracyclin repressor-like, C-terminal domain